MTHVKACSLFQWKHTKNPVTKKRSIINTTDRQTRLYKHLTKKRHELYIKWTPWKLKTSRKHHNADSIYSDQSRSENAVMITTVNCSWMLPNVKTSHPVSGNNTSNSFWATRRPDRRRGRLLLHSNSFISCSSGNTLGGLQLLIVIGVDFCIL